MRANVATMTVLGLLLTAAGIITPILWDQYKTRAELTLSVLGPSSIIERKEDVQELRVLYGNKPVESVSKASFILKNTGRKPIVKESVRQPIRITFKANVLKQSIEAAFPHKEDYAINKIDDHTVEIGFDLLNPGDFVAFSTLLDGSAKIADTTGRIVGIKALRIADASPSDGELQGIVGKLGITGGIVLFFSAGAFLIVVFVAIPEIVYEKKLRANWTSVDAILNTPIRKADLRSSIAFLLFPKRSDQLKPIYQTLEEIETEYIRDEEELATLKDQISAAVNVSSGAQAAGVMFAIMALIGLGYIASRLFI